MNTAVTATLTPNKLQDDCAISLAFAVEAANHEAVRLGYNLEKLSLRVTQGTGKNNGLWHIYYRPNNPQQRGGDIDIYVNATDFSIQRVLRGQ